MRLQTANQKEVYVVGGGFTGLVTAYYLQKHGMQISIFEKEARLGGVIQTEQSSYGPVETAANAFLNTEELQAICADIGCTLIHTLPQSRRRYFFRDNKLSRFPLRWSEIPGFLFHVLKLLVKRSLKPIPGESMVAWAQRNFGKAAALHIVSTALNGIYSGDANRLSAELIVGPFFEKKAVPRSKIKKGSVAPYLGMGDFITCLRNHLQNHNVQIYQKVVTAELIEEWRNQNKVIVVCTGVKVASHLLSRVDERQSQLLGQVQSLSLISAQVFWQEPCATLNGFGALIDQDEHLKVLGVLANNRIFANRGNHYSETWIFGGQRSPEVINLTDQEIQQLILKESSVIFKEKREPVSVFVHRWPDVLPHYDFTLLEVLRSLAKISGVYQIGNYSGRIGLSKIIEQAKVLAQEVANEETANRDIARQRGHAEISSQI